MAIQLGIELLEAKGIETSLYKIVAAENLISRRYFVGAHVWHLAFKPRRLIPDSSNVEIGAGGEVFVEVDAVTGQAVLLGHGE